MPSRGRVRVCHQPIHERLAPGRLQSDSSQTPGRFQSDSSQTPVRLQSDSRQAQTPCRLVRLQSNMG